MRHGIALVLQDFRPVASFILLHHCLRIRQGGTSHCSGWAVKHVRKTFRARLNVLVPEVPRRMM